MLGPDRIRAPGSPPTRPRQTASFPAKTPSRRPLTWRVGWRPYRRTAGARGAALAQLAHRTGGPGAVPVAAQAESGMLRDGGQPCCAGTVERAESAPRDRARSRSDLNATVLRW